MSECIVNHAKIAETLKLKGQNPTVNDLIKDLIDEAIYGESQFPKGLYEFLCEILHDHEHISPCSLEDFLLLYRDQRGQEFLVLPPSNE